MSRIGWIAVALFVVAAVVFRASPRGQLYDSRYALLVSHQLLTTGSPSLDQRVDELGGTDGSGQPHDYRIVRSGGHYHWFYPPGTPLLTLPFVALASAADAGPVDAAGRYDRRGERRLQRTLAAGAMALCGVLFLLIAREWLPLGASVLVAVGGLFAGPVWSTTSRSLWSQTPAMLLVTLAIWLLARARRPDTSIHPVWLATLLAWAWLCRPTAALPAAAVVAYVAWTRRSSLRPLLAGGLAWGALFVVGFQAVYGQGLPAYFQPRSHAFALIPEALAGNWISPARGMLVYSPVLVVVVVWLWRGWDRLPDRPLAVVALASITLHWLLVSSHGPWWGGYGYGARLMADVVPWVVLLAALGWAAARQAPEPARRSEVVLAVGLLVVSMGMNGIGAISRAATEWNHHQAEADFGERLWRFDDAPFLAPFRASFGASGPGAADGRDG